MIPDKQWFEITKYKDYLYVIRERLDDIDTRFHTIFVNLFLIIGAEKALLIDTGCGIFPLKPLVDDLKGSKDLIVVNTHTHFDHRGSSDEFEEIYVHENEEKSLLLPYDLTFIKDSEKPLVNLYEKKEWKLNPAKSVNPIVDGDEFDLGGITIKAIHTPGHSIGSISLMTNKGELFTGDTAHYGTMYLPKKRDFPIMLHSLKKLIDVFENCGLVEIYPSHEDYPVGKELLVDLYDGIMNIENLWYTKKKDKFLHAWLIDDGIFKYLI